MKKVISLVLVLAMTVSCLVCGNCFAEENVKKPPITNISQEIKKEGGNCFAEENVEKFPTKNISQEVKKEESSKFGKIKKALCVVLPLLGAAVIGFLAKDPITKFLNKENTLPIPENKSTEIANINSRQPFSLDNIFRSNADWVCYKKNNVLHCVFEDEGNSADLNSQLDGFALSDTKALSIATQEEKIPSINSAMIPNKKEDVITKNSTEINCLRDPNNFCYGPCDEDGNPPICSVEDKNIDISSLKKPDKFVKQGNKVFDVNRELKRSKGEIIVSGVFLSLIAITGFFSVSGLILDSMGCI